MNMNDYRELEKRFGTRIADAMAKGDHPLSKSSGMKKCDSCGKMAKSHETVCSNCGAPIKFEKMNTEHDEKGRFASKGGSGGGKAKSGGGKKDFAAAHAATDKAIKDAESKMKAGGGPDADKAFSEAWAQKIKLWQEDGSISPSKPKATPAGFNPKFTAGKERTNEFGTKEIPVDNDGVEIGVIEHDGGGYAPRHWATGAGDSIYDTKKEAMDDLKQMHKDYLENPNDIDNEWLKEQEHPKAKVKAVVNHFGGKKQKTGKA